MFVPGTITINLLVPSRVGYLDKVIHILMVENQWKECIIVSFE